MNALRQRPLSRRPSSHRLLGVVLLALLLAQWAALSHRISHGISHGARLVAWSQGATTERDAVWSHAAGSASCQLADQILIGQATGGEPPVLPPTQLGTTPSACLRPALVARLALRAYEARGPPRG